MAEPASIVDYKRCPKCEQMKLRFVDRVSKYLRENGLGK